LQRTAGNRAVTSLIGAAPRSAGAVPQLVVQRYETGEHALIGGGRDYPMVNTGEIALPNGARATPGELVAFGDFYADLDQMARMPRQETEALIGFTRLEALWYQARRAKSPSPRGLRVFPDVDGNDPVWQQKAAGGRTLGQHRRAIYEQFRPSFAFFEIAFAEDVAPPGGIISLKATIGRRRFRDVNDTLAGPGQQPTRDPARMGGDYVDLASQNVSHFATDNFATWAAEHVKACAEHRAGKRAAALARDALGLHYLTDRFSAGHVVNKEELMTFATNLMVTVAESHGHKKGSRHDKIRALMKDALEACFEAPALKVQWDLGCRDAFTQGLINRGDFELLTTLGRRMLPGQILDVVMGMPWRNVRGQMTLDATSRSFGPPSAPTGKGDYQLGVGNLAAKQVHDVLNAIGFVVSAGDGSSWRMQGDDHLTVAAQDRAHALVELSQRQVRSGRPDVDAVRRRMPAKVRIDPAAIKEYFQGGNAALFDPKRVAGLVALVESSPGIVLPVDGKAGKGAASPEITEICHRLMEILFLPSGTKAAEKTIGLNIASLRAFLQAHLREMVPLTYAVASAADLPQAAQEAYAPHAFKPDGTAVRLPTAANDFRLDGSKVSFNLNVTGCQPGPYVLGFAVFDRDIDYDTTPFGRHKGPGVSDPNGGLLRAAVNAKDIENRDEVQQTGTFTVAVPKAAAPTANAGGRTLLPVTINASAMGAGRLDDFWRDNYLMVYADAGRRMAIGRSPSRNDAARTRENVHPVTLDPRTTGPDRTPTVPAALAATRASGFSWSGKTLRFKVDPKGVPVVYVNFYDKDLGYDYDRGGNQRSGLRDTDEFLAGYAVRPQPDGTASVKVSGAADDPWDSYAVVYSDAARRLPIGRSDTQPRW
jgi:hypothetical protein